MTWDLTPESFETLLPLAVEWAESLERHALSKGTSLSPALLEDAERLGVERPERVRLFGVRQMPLPENPLLRAAAEATHFLSPDTLGLTLRYGILLRADYRQDRKLIVHELVHTTQYERLGGFQPFLRRYLEECLTLGYPNGPLEREAIRAADEMCG